MKITKYKIIAKDDILNTWSLFYIDQNYIMKKTDDSPFMFDTIEEAKDFFEKFPAGFEYGILEWIIEI
jgi:hypothetical protein